MLTWEDGILLDRDESCQVLGDVTREERTFKCIARQVSETREFRWIDSIEELDADLRTSKIEMTDFELKVYRTESGNKYYPLLWKIPSAEGTEQRVKRHRVNPAGKYNVTVTRVTTTVISEKGEIPW